MRQTMMAILRFYPAEYREEFGSEIVDTVLEGASHARSQGPAEYAAFCAGELAGLMLGAVREWTTKWTEHDGYVVPGRDPEDETEVMFLHRRIHQLIRGMEFAIANHDFRKARLYSDQERAARQQLQQVLSDSQERYA